MSKKKLFIASSNIAKPLARQLELSLTVREIDARVWDIENNNFHGRTSLDKLLEAGKTYEFAVVILIQEDIHIDTSAERLFNVPRDNCIFELGFFIGALDLNPQRCFLVTSLQKDALPDDLKGYIYYQIQNPKDLNDPEQCADCIRSVSVNISDRVDRTPVLERLPEDTVISVTENTKLIEFKREQIRLYLLTSAELIKLETTENSSLESDSEVLVKNNNHALANDLAWAKQVRSNMDQGITYHYFFSIDKDADPKTTIRIADMIRSLAIVNVLNGNNTLDDQWKTNEINRKNILNDNINTVQNSLQNTIKYQLFIHFLPHKLSLSEDFRIHNADVRHKIRCYLRWLGTDYFIQLNQHQAWNKYESYRGFMHTNKPTIFGSTDSISLHMVDQQLNLRTALKEKFYADFINDDNQIFFGP